MVFIIAMMGANLWAQSHCNRPGKYRIQLGEAVCNNFNDPLSG